MGDVADMMLEGMLCEGCGITLGHSVGYPRRCADCEHDFMAEELSPFVRCPQCNKKVKRIGLKQHQEAKHNER